MPLLNLYVCDCFVFPSFYEGFGLPIWKPLPACRGLFEHHMPEVADGAGLLFNPIRSKKSPGYAGYPARLRVARPDGTPCPQRVPSTRKSACATLDVYKVAVAAVSGQLRLEGRGGRAEPMTNPERHSGLADGGTGFRLCCLLIAFCALSFGAQAAVHPSSSLTGFPVHRRRPRIRSTGPAASLKQRIFTQSTSWREWNFTGRCGRLQSPGKDAYAASP